VDQVGPDAGRFVLAVEQDDQTYVAHLDLFDPTLLGTVGAVGVAPPVVTSWLSVSFVGTDLFGVVVRRRGERGPDSDTCSPHHQDTTGSGSVVEAGQ
jgi:hypothetical protein